MQTHFTDASRSHFQLGVERKLRYPLAMTRIEEEILEALTELNRTVRNMNAKPAKLDLQELFRRLDTLALDLPKTADSNLRHYLHKKSYEKARLFLLGKESENSPGNCGHL